jgi:hypothetical protein
MWGTLENVNLAAWSAVEGIVKTEVEEGSEQEAGCGEDMPEILEVPVNSRFEMVCNVRGCRKSRT